MLTVLLSIDAALYFRNTKLDRAREAVEIKKIVPAIEELHRHYYENRKLSYYADMCYLSESHFRKLFKEYTGMTLIAYRNQIRIAQVRKLISSEEYSVQEAAYQVGFHNMSFFYEVLRKSD